MSNFSALAFDPFVTGIVATGGGIVYGVTTGITYGCLWGGRTVLNKLNDAQGNERQDLGPFQKTLIKVSGYALFALGATSAVAAIAVGGFTASVLGSTAAFIIAPALTTTIAPIAAVVGGILAMAHIYSFAKEFITPSQPPADEVQ